eukprot:1161982-Pelagomonas_calceolata.AAC.10
MRKGKHSCWLPRRGIVMVTSALQYWSTPPYRGAVLVTSALQYWSAPPCRGAVLFTSALLAVLLRCSVVHLCLVGCPVE